MDLESEEVLSESNLHLDEQPMMKTQESDDEPKIEESQPNCSGQPPAMTYKNGSYQKCFIPPPFWMVTPENEVIFRPGFLHPPREPIPRFQGVFCGPISNMSKKYEPNYYMKSGLNLLLLQEKEREEYKQKITLKKNTIPNKTVPIYTPSHNTSNYNLRPPPPPPNQQSSFVYGPPPSQNMNTCGRPPNQNISFCGPPRNLNVPPFGRPRKQNTPVYGPSPSQHSPVYGPPLNPTDVSGPPSNPDSHDPIQNQTSLASGATFNQETSSHIPVLSHYDLFCYNNQNVPLHGLNFLSPDAQMQENPNQVTNCSNANGPNIAKNNSTNESSGRKKTSEEVKNSIDEIVETFNNFNISSPTDSDNVANNNNNDSNDNRLPCQNEEIVVVHAMENLRS